MMILNMMAMITIDNMITNTIDNSTCLHWSDDHLHLKVSANVWRPVMWRASLNILSHNHLHCYLISLYYLSYLCIILLCHQNLLGHGQLSFLSLPFLFGLWYFSFPPQDPHDPEYLSNPPHLAFVFGLTATNSALHTSSYCLKDTDTNTTRKRKYINIAKGTTDPGVDCFDQ